MYDTYSASRILSNVETPEAIAEQVQELLAKIMVSVFDKLFKTQVPIEVGAKICQNWVRNEGVSDGVRKLVRASGRCPRVLIGRGGEIRMP